MQRGVSVVGFACLLLTAACGSDPAVVPDGGSDAGPLCAAPDAFTTGSVDGDPTPLAAPAGQARAGRVVAADLPPDPFDLATWAAGDYVIANDHMALVLSQLGRYEVYDPYAGRPRGISRVESGRLVEPADFEVALLGLGRFVVATESVTVLADGTDGGAAIVRAAGPLVAIEAVGDLLATLLPGRLTGLPAALDYVLEPGSDAIEVRISLRTGGNSMATRFGTSAFFQSYRMPLWSETLGFQPVSGEQRFIAFEDADATSYAWLAPENADGTPGIIKPLISTGGFDFFTVPTASVPACSEQSFVLGSFAIGDGPGLNGVQRVLARTLGDTTRHVHGTLTSSDPLAIAGARVHLTDATGTQHFTRALVDETGVFDLDVPAAATHAWVWREGAPLEGPFAIAADGTLTVPLAPLATVRVDTLDDATSTPMPARVQLFPTAGPPVDAPPLFGERSLERGRARLEFTGASGHVDLRVAPGSYRLVVSRGWEFERDDRNVDLAASTVTDVSASLLRAFDTPGIMCADFHIHTHRSVDSADTGFQKVSSLVGDGLEIAVRSEHEWVSDFQPVVESLGLADFALGLGGEEITTFTYGHFGAFPLVPDAARPSGGAVTWYNRLAPEVFADVRGRPEAPLLVINHPRAGGVKQGYFEVLGYDPVTGSVADPDNWDESFDVMEITNSSNFESNRAGTVQDWFSFLRAGRRVMGVGSSDSHRITNDPVGYPRTCLSVGTDDPRALTPNRVRDVTRSGASFITGGIYLEVTGPSGIGPGGEATGVGATASIDVIVRAPSFVSVDRLEVFVDGLTTEVIPILPTDTEPGTAVRLRATLTVPVASAGSFVVLYASGSEEPDISYGGLPFGVTNPLFLRR
jgi:hypothetical protein